MKKIFYRLKNGTIGCLVGEIKSLIDDNRYFELDNGSFMRYEEFLDSLFQTSPEIIDLIQPGDIVNDKLVLKHLRHNISVVNPDYVNGVQLLSNDEIESVISKEEYENIKYYVSYE